MYIGDYLGRRAIYSPENLAIVDTASVPERRFNYWELNERANRLANWLQNHGGVAKGDRVAILARDGVEHLDCFFACSKLGAIHTALNWRLHWRELAGIMDNTMPKVLIFSGEFAETTVALADHLQNQGKDLPACLHLDGSGCHDSIPFDVALESASDTPVTCESLEADDAAALILTGGTTGTPKASIVSHRMIAWNTLNTVIHDVTHNDIYLNVFPLFHTGGLFVYTLPQIIFGGTTILMRQFDPVRVLDLIEREGVTIFAGVPTMFQMLTQAPNWNAADLTSLRFCTSGGAPLPVPLVEKYAAEKGVRFKQGFGMTEFGPGIFALAPEDAIRKAGSIGRPNFFVDARVVDDDNNPLGPNQVGELVLRGPSCGSGYFNNPEASAEVLDDQGWLHTGDLARYDDEWYFYIVGRKKEMFVSGGENVYPAEIEAVLYRHPAVLQCAVVGIPDEKWGEIGMACVVLKPETRATEEDLIAFLREHLARYKVPRKIVFLDELPLSGAGKILKRELRERFADG